MPLRKDLKILNNFTMIYSHSVGHKQPEAVGRTYLLYDGEETVVRCGNH